MLLRAPAGWPQPLVATIAMVLLAALDLGGAFAAKEAVDRRSMPLAAFGAGLFLVLFWVYISSLEVAELSSVTFGWIVILQVGVILLDRFRYGVIPAPGAWLAIAVLLAAQAYLIMAPSAVPASAEGDEQSVEAVHDDVTAELGHPQRADADADHRDQQRLSDGVVAAIPGARVAVDEVAAETSGGAVEILGAPAEIPGITARIAHVSPQRKYSSSPTPVTRA